MDKQNNDTIHLLWYFDDLYSLDANIYASSEDLVDFSYSRQY